jgi:2-keto-4-pentenoate hydratase/2-oxohepta-3-ene-1,7-dioic acid hydratase in catechol pathway
VFALATVAQPRGQSVAALRLDGEFWPLGGNAMDLFQDWDKSFARLEKFKKRGKPLRGKLLTPLRYPRKLFCVGANYADHLREMNGRPKANELRRARKTRIVCR